MHFFYNGTEGYKTLYSIVHFIDSTTSGFVYLTSLLMTLKHMPRWYKLFNCLIILIYCPILCVWGVGGGGQIWINIHYKQHIFFHLSQPLNSTPTWPHDGALVLFKTKHFQTGTLQNSYILKKIKQNKTWKIPISYYWRSIMMDLCK